MRAMNEAIEGADAFQKMMEKATGNCRQDLVAPTSHRQDYRRQRRARLRAESKKAQRLAKARP